MKIKITLSLILIFAVTLSVSFLLYTDRIMIRIPLMVQQNPKITFVIGNAWYRKSASDKWEVAIVGQTLNYGYEIKTGDNTQMDVRFHNSMAVRLSENSILRLDDISVRKTHLQLNKGSLYGKFEKLFKEYDISIKTPTTIAAVRGTDLGFVITEENEELKQADTQTTKGKKEEEETVETEPIYSTMVYCLSGITELGNPKVEERKVLLSYQNKIQVRENLPPENPEKMTDDEVMSMRVKLNSIHTEEVLFISDKINFEVGSSKILPDSYNELEKIFLILKEKKVKIRIEGHTDSRGTASLNQPLSVSRARSIREYFISKGIKPEYLTIAGYGASKPIADNEKEKGRALNRRVEFIIME